MSQVEVSPHEPLEKALRRFKKKIEREGILKTLKARKHYEKPVPLPWCLDALGGFDQEIPLVLVFPGPQVLRNDVGNIVLGSQPPVG